MKCLNCGEETKYESNFCNATCSYKWERKVSELPTKGEVKREEPKQEEKKSRFEIIRAVSPWELKQKLNNILETQNIISINSVNDCGMETWLVIVENKTEGELT